MVNAEQRVATAAVPGGGERPGDAARARLVLWGLWAVAAVLAVRQAAAVLRLPPAERLTDLGTWIGPQGVLHVGGPLYDGGRFTGTPFAGLVLKPLTRAAEDGLGVVWTFGTLLLVAAVGLVAARALPGPVPARTARLAAPRALPGPVPARTARLAAPVAIILLMVSLPVRNTFTLGQTSVLPVLLVLLGCLAVRGGRAAGVLVGVAAALQPTALLFAPLLWFTGRRTSALTAAGTFAAGTAFAWAALPGDSWAYWVHHLAGAGLGAAPDALGNQSLHGALLRFGLTGPLEIALFLVLAAAVTFLGLRRAVRYARDGQPLLAVALTGCVSVAVSPTAWQHQLLWLLLAVVGRTGKRAADRLVWPAAVVIVMTLPGSMLLPNMDVMDPVRDNALLLIALAAAVIVPFQLRASPHWAAPIPTPYEKGTARGLWRRALTPPHLLLELLAIRIGYSAYSIVRGAANGGPERAEAHGHQILGLEQALGLDLEHGANRLLTENAWLEGVLNFYYTSFHFTFPLTLLGVLYLSSPVHYRWARTALALTTLLGLVGFWLYPLAPPRLMPGLGYVDTIHGPQDFDAPDYGALTAVSNQYAAMPSLHFGWSLWCALVVAMLAPWAWVRVVAFAHPATTLVSIVGTANHWTLDAAGGAAVVVGGFALTRLLSGPRPAVAVEGGPLARLWRRRSASGEGEGDGPPVVGTAGPSAGERAGARS
ncbi:bifunctional glycosyltransferase 87/phosphatase PAP2 family protein [Streptomyces sp. NPDC060194]|uniref:bifunctional glycosyltransferase 87/phosphatase PAP2 family protein n=1 Tax=Streptomyces sp. NPDC060194 TaxID=3347069 RepID=UPI00364CD92C